mmetsp:Transcript_13545/g.45186  ORF Transcript_13545/g.45186 Transcript_13545/m.45186 type:complete len:209 (-) Transcript_13545:1307-1933(-)
MRVSVCLARPRAGVSALAVCAPGSSCASLRTRWSPERGGGGWSWPRGLQFCELAPWHGTLRRWWELQVCAAPAGRARGPGPGCGACWECCAVFVFDYGARGGRLTQLLAREDLRASPSPTRTTTRLERGTFTHISVFVRCAASDERALPQPPIPLPPPPSSPPISSRRRGRPLGNHAGLLSSQGRRRAWRARRGGSSSPTRCRTTRRA